LIVANIIFYTCMIQHLENTYRYMGSNYDFEDPSPET